MREKDRLIRLADSKLHDIMEQFNTHTEVGRLAAEAHYAVHDLAGLLSDDPEIQASLPAPPESF